MSNEKAEKLLRSLTDVKEDYILEMDKTNNRVRPRRWPLAVAAVLVVALLCGGVAAAAYGDTIAGWFQQTWRQITGQEMGEGHMALIQSLTQDIGLSQTVDGVTVTVDSAAVGEDRVFVLLRVEGLRASRDGVYGLEPCGFEMERDFNDHNVRSLSAPYIGLNEEGALLFLLEYESALSFFTPEDGTLPVRLSVGGVTRNRDGRAQELAAGDWSFDFSLELSEAFQSIALGDLETDIDGIHLSIRELEINSTGIKFRSGPSAADILPGSFVAVLSDGTEIACDEGGGAMTEEGDFLSSCHWQAPIDLEDVAALRIGETEIPIG